MNKKGLKLDINPELILWAVKSSGWKEKDIIVALKVKEKVYRSWVEGNDKPSLNQLENLSSKTKRPLASFFLSKVPEEKPTPKDYRMLPEKEGEFTRKTILAIRRARNLQQITKELSSNIYEDSKLKIKKQNIRDSPKEIAKEIRNKFEITEEKQKKFKDSYKFLSFLREKLGEINIFPFQISMPLEDARGFALSDDVPNIVAMNSQDTIEARIFTLMHEVGHILLGNTGISIPDFNNQNKIEKWCNEFASSFLLPESMAKQIFENNKKELVETKTLNSLSRKYKLSKAMLLYNMVKLKFISFGKYNEVLNRYRKIEITKQEKSGGAGITADKRCISELGNRFISLVADNIDKKQITYSDALSYLSIKSKNFNKLLNKI